MTANHFTEMLTRMMPILAFNRSTESSTEASIHNQRMPFDEKQNTVSDSIRGARLARVRAQGFRSFRDVDLSLSNLTVLVGPNGSGKSNFVSLLNLLDALRTGRLQNYVDDQRGASRILFRGSDYTQQCALRFTFALPSGSILKYDLKLHVVPGDTLEVRDETIEFLSGKASQKWDLPGGKEAGLPEFLAKDNLWPSEDQVSTEQNGLKPLVSAMVKSLLFGPIFSTQVYHFHNTSSSSPLRRFQEMRSNKSLARDGSNLAVMLELFRERHNSVYRRIVGEMKSILPSFLDFVLEPDPRRGGEQIELCWTPNFDRLVFGPDQLSDGSLRAAALLALLLQPRSMRPAVVVIDEPELGLHPEAVGIIGRLIAECSTDQQMVVSTQSPILLSQFSKEDIVVTAANPKNGESTVSRLENDDLDSWLDEFGDLGTIFQMNVFGGRD